MTDSLLAPDLDGVCSRPGDVSTVSDQISRLMRVIHALKTAITAGGDSRERAAHVLLFPLLRLGPQRQGALAEMVHADPSTISRHVALLVENGLVRRVADASDGRASQLVITPAGESVVAAMHREREALFHTVTADWSDSELATFGSLLDRFVSDLTDALPAVAAAAQGTPAPQNPAGAAGAQRTRPTPEKDR
ncbi:MarR family winged helix-turn-helix transcriptional regulator [Klenkia brasiliensis]|uniref:DNA-binding transcriptional regulator, MarR family n=1 Tax=Klenkia brasiliensis TaxID=333142 RepID=A0A1G7QNZ9_9ACTN|nr:MarR family winged helix-turn-helix transcriptional regulator [Klenkia brasiliensis]SDG00218.1 DNA-binding transcriptional regulator, MarR family [Klenkia brasiliensis]